MLEDYELSKKNENLYAYQLSAHVLKLFGMNNGLLTKFHQMYHNYDNYKSNLKILQYDMLYGKKEVYDELSPYEPTDLQMGFDPIRITGCFFGRWLGICHGQKLYGKQLCLY